MEAVAWSALGLLAATVIAAIFWLGTRIDGLGASLNTRIDHLGDSLNARIDGLNARMDAQTSELSKLSGRLDEHLGRHAS
jgi:hypothetical protein